MKDLILKGSHKKDKELKNFDIIKSNISCIKGKCSQPRKTMVYNQNQLTISKKANNEFYIYHMFDSYKDNYNGRWYDAKFDLSKSLNHKDKTIVTVMKFEDFDLGNKYDVKIVIYFNESGWNKILQIIK